MSDKFLGFLGLTKKSKNLIEGYNKCEEAMKNSKVYLLILSEDISENTKEKFIRSCESKNIQYIQCYGSEELGRAIGKSEISVLCVTDKNMSDKLMSLYNFLKINRG